MNDVTVATQQKDVKAIKEATRYLESIVPDLLSNHWQSSFECVLSSVEHNLVKHIPGYQISDKFIWKNVSEINMFVVKHMSVDFNNAWKIVYDFLYEHIGADVKKEEEKVQKHFDLIDSLGIKNNFISRWSIVKTHDGNFNFDDAYPVKMASLGYSISSGTGHPSSVVVPEGATYLDLWKLADDLIRFSQDNHHIFIEGFACVDVKNQKYELILGS